MPKYIAGFKRKGPGKIWWLECEADNEKDATKKLEERTEGAGPGWNLYAGPFKEEAQK